MAVIPDSLTRRFNWFAAGDVNLKQQLLNHLQGLEKKLVVEDSPYPLLGIVLVV